MAYNPNSPNRKIRLPNIPTYQKLLDPRGIREIIEWIKRLSECVEQGGLSDEDRAFLDLLKSLLDLTGGTIDLQGFNVVIESNMSGFPSVGNTFTLYVLDNADGIVLYAWKDTQYVPIMQSPSTINVIRGGNASG